jgi:hypothetical protein
MLIDNKVTRFGEGVTNVDVANIFASLRTMDPSAYHMYFNDFDNYVAGDWTTDTVGAATEALQDADGGRLLLTNAAADNDRDFLFLNGEAFLMATGKPAFFKALIQPNLVVEADIFVGLAPNVADPVGTAPTDGVFFRCDDGDASLDFVATKDSVAVTDLAVATLVAATDVELAFYWDGIDRIWYAVDGTVTGYITPGVSFPDDEELTPFFGIQNGEAVAKTLAIDYLLAAKER